jgi:hypothetical protein
MISLKPSTLLSSRRTREGTCLLVFDAMELDTWIFLSEERRWA